MLFLPYLFGALIWGGSFILLLSRRTQWLLISAIVLAIFHEASVLVLHLGSSHHRAGVEPTTIPMLCFMISVFFEKERLSYHFVIKKFWPFYLFLAWAVLINMTGPFLFKGITTENAWLTVGQFEPLHFTITNIESSLRLTSNFLIFTSILVYSPLLSPQKIRQLFWAALVAFLLVFILSISQFLSFLHVFPFSGAIQWPASLIFNKMFTGTQYHYETTSYFTRVQGPFSEPSNLSYYLNGIFLGVCLLFVRSKFPSKAFCFLLGLLCLISINAFFEISASAYLSLACSMFVSFIYALFFNKSACLKLIFAALLIAIICFIQSFLIDLAFSPKSFCTNTYLQTHSINRSECELHKAIAPTKNQTLDKPQSGSFKARTATDIQAFKTLWESHGVGVGMGSFKASSLVPSFLVENGLLGAFLVAWFFLKVFLLKKDNIQIENEKNYLFAPNAITLFFGGLTLGNLITGAIAVSDINFFFFWQSLSLWVALKLRYSDAFLNMQCSNHGK